MVCRVRGATPNTSRCNSSRRRSHPASVRDTLASVTPYRRLATLFASTGEVIELWSAAFDRSRLSGPGGLGAAALEPVMASIVEEIYQALPAERADGVVLPGGLAPGSTATRDLEKAAAFAGASMTALGGSGFDMAAALLALRDVAVACEPEETATVHRMFEWLTVVALDAYANAGIAAAREKQRALLEQRTPVVLLTPFLPAVLLVGQPDRTGLDAIFSRLLLSVVRVGARVAIIDATGLVDPMAESVLDSLHGLVSHRKVSGRLAITAVGLDREHAQRWSSVCSDAKVGFRKEEVLASAVSSALTASGYRLQRAPSNS